MSDEHLRAHLHLGELNERASSAASALLQKTTGAQAPDLRHIALARRLFVTAALVVLGLVIGAVLLVSFVASGALPWIVGVFLVLAAVGVVRPRVPCRRPWMVRPYPGAGTGGGMGANGVGRRLGLRGRVGVGPLAFAQRRASPPSWWCRPSPTVAPLPPRWAPNRSSAPGARPSAPWTPTGSSSGEQRDLDSTVP